MTATDTVAIDDLNALLTERQRYEQWLEALDKRRDSTPARVYARVHEDYSSRLQGVMQKLAERADQLSATISDLSSRAAALRARENELTDERHEVELRAAVGEFTPEEWDRRRAAADRELGGIGSDREAVEAQLGELERIVAATRPASAESAAAAPERTEWTERTERTEAPPGVRDDAATAATPSIDEFVEGRSTPQERAEAATASATAQGDGVPEVPEVDETGAIGESTSGSTGNPIGAAAALYSIANGIPTRAASREATRAPNADTRRESDKTLKCPECGAMNYATEWYCERCGGELSTF